MGTLYPNTLAHVTEEGILLFLPLNYLHGFKAECTVHSVRLQLVLSIIERESSFFVLLG